MASPLAAHAQQAERIRRIGVLMNIARGHFTNTRRDRRALLITAPIFAPVSNKVGYYPIAFA